MNGDHFQGQPHPPPGIRPSHHPARPPAHIQQFAYDVGPGGALVNAMDPHAVYHLVPGPATSINPYGPGSWWASTVPFPAYMSEVVYPSFIVQPSYVAHLPAPLPQRQRHMSLPPFVMHPPPAFWSPVPPTNMPHTGPIGTHRPYSQPTFYQPQPQPQPQPHPPTSDQHSNLPRPPRRGRRDRQRDEVLDITSHPDHAKHLSGRNRAGRTSLGCSHPHGNPEIQGVHETDNKEASVGDDRRLSGERVTTAVAAIVTAMFPPSDDPEEYLRGEDEAMAVDSRPDDVSPTGGESPGLSPTASDTHSTPSLPGTTSTPQPRAATPSASNSSLPQGLPSRPEPRIWRDGQTTQEWLASRTYDPETGCWETGRLQPRTRARSFNHTPHMAHIPYDPASNPKGSFMASPMSRQPSSSSAGSTCKTLRPLRKVHGHAEDGQGGEDGEGVDGQGDQGSHGKRRPQHRGKGRMKRLWRKARKEGETMDFDEFLAMSGHGGNGQSRQGTGEAT